MSKEPAVPHGVMEGKGSYNKNARLPGNAATLAAPFLEKAVSRISIDADRPIVIADYGSSQGKNSLAPMRLAIARLRLRLKHDHPIVVFHVDQPSNDFNSLFEVLSSDPDSYSLNDPAIFPCAVGRSFYESVIPGNSVHLAWSSYAVVWLSHLPSLASVHFMPLLGDPGVRAQFDNQAAEDWKRFLSLRASELRPGGRLVVLLPAIADDGLTGFENLFNQANAALAQMVDDGTITADERARMVLGSHPRRTEALLAPFAPEGHFHGLTVEDCNLLPLPDGAWVDYQDDGDRDALGTKQSAFFRSVFVPSLATALDSVRNGEPEAVQRFGDGLCDRLKPRLARDPKPIDSFVQVLVAAKEHSKA
ncbi:MAG TPA: SAM-dependent methyltransferase [Blastocatellia bacterium]